MRAIEQLCDQKVVRFVGITGHYDAQVLLRAIRDYEFDTVLLPLNAADIHYSPFQTELLQTAVQKRMGILAMKVVAKGRLLRPDGVSGMREALGYTPSFPITSAVIGISTLRELEQNVQLASSLHLPLPVSEIARLERLAAGSAADGNWFKRQA